MTIVTKLPYRINVARAKLGASLLRSIIDQGGTLDLIKMGKRSSRIRAISISTVIEKKKVSR